MKINGFPGYTYKDGVLYNPKNKAVNIITNARGSQTYKVKNYLGKWTHLALLKLKALVGEVLELPSDAKQIKGFEDYYIDPRGIMYSFSSYTPAGSIMTTGVGSNGYPRVSLGSNKTVEVHQLLARTFIMDDYIERGLVVLHRDDNKLNCTLDNICVGTYKRNNKDSYKTGCNPGNGLKEQNHGQ